MAGLCSNKFTIDNECMVLRPEMVIVLRVIGGAGSTQIPASPQRLKIREVTIDAGRCRRNALMYNTPGEVPMKIILARTAGFCHGVRNAMNRVLDLMREEERSIYTIGPLVHNPQAVEFLRQRGVQVLEPACPPRRGVAVVRSHGVSPKIRGELAARGLTICNATCARVSAVQSIVKKCAGLGHAVLIIGDHGHAEVDGLLGYAGEHGWVISTEEDFDLLPRFEQVCIVSQTTQDRTIFNRLVQRIREKYTDARVFDTICSATSDRQDELCRLTDQADIIIVVGGHNSANTTRLADIARRNGRPTLHIESAQELNADDVRGYRTIGVTAGASTPNWVIREVVDKLRSIRWQDHSVVLRTAAQIFEFALKSNLYIAAGAAALSFATSRLQGLPLLPTTALLAALYVLSMHILNRFTDREALLYNEPLKGKFYRQYGRSLGTMAIISAVGALFLAWQMADSVLVLIFAATLLGLVYGIKIIPRRWSSGHRVRRLKDIPGSKAILVALAWSIVTVFPPLLVMGQPVSAATLTALLFSFLLVYLRCVTFDIRDMQGDRMMGRETIPMLLGEESMRKLILLVLVVWFISLFVAVLLGLAPGVAWGLLTVIVYVGIFLLVGLRSIFLGGNLNEAAIDGAFLVAGTIALLEYVV